MAGNGAGSGESSVRSSVIAPAAHAPRTLWAAPILLQDWDEEAEEMTAKYWELFLDLLLVAAASSMADGLQENPTVSGWFEMAVLYLCFCNSWMLYTHHITARFYDASLSHVINLFFFLVGFAICIVNASFQYAESFALGLVLQRVAVLLMLLVIGLCIPRTRPFCLLEGTITGLAALMFLALAIKSSTKDEKEANEGLEEFVPRYVPALLWTGAIVEWCGEFIMVYGLPGRLLVPVNIEHSKDRLGILILVMLGETAISATITYREIRGEREEEEEAGEREDRMTDSYYVVLGMCFLLIFMFCQLYFHMQPEPKHHAFRRSRFHGCTLIWVVKLLGLSFLSLGVAVKSTVKAVAQDEELSLFASQLMGYSVGVASVLMVGLRLLHYGGIVPRRQDTPPELYLLWAWWISVFVLMIVPFVLTWMLGGTVLRNPVAAISTYAGLLFSWNVLETIYSSALSDYFAELYREDDENEVIAEGTSLLGRERSEGTSYPSLTNDS